MPDLSAFLITERRTAKYPDRLQLCSLPTLNGVKACGIHRMTYLSWLSLGAFAIGTEGFMIAGLLPALARDLNVGLAAAGHLVTAFSLAYAIGAPVMAVLTARLERRRLLAVAMGSFTLANLLAALAPSYTAVVRATAVGLVRRQLHAGG